MAEKKYKAKLKELVTDSKLDQKKKNLWDLFMQISIDEEDEAVFEAVSTDEENLLLLTKHLEGQIVTMKEKNPSAWGKLAGENN